ncbi:unnamed protein product [Clonostachys rosea f. rosea IK726]|uniref:Uncharacterized protein n=1 Tax=Clonostachys rosea f. rosea IK726 TaxID=1349383 RepID=A0ACA9T7A0_BIOOC|nr:unnamed protein product [Clonostachys rosea f. rosea IK726]
MRIPHAKPSYRNETEFIPRGSLKPRYIPGGSSLNDLLSRDTPNRTALIVVLSVGVPILLILTGYILYRRRKKRNAPWRPPKSAWGKLRKGATPKVMPKRQIGGSSTIQAPAPAHTTQRTGIPGEETEKGLYSERSIDCTNQGLANHGDGGNAKL